MKKVHAHHSIWLTGSPLHMAKDLSKCGKKIPLCSGKNRDRYSDITCLNCMNALLKEYGEQIESIKAQAREITRRMEDQVKRSKIK